MRHELDHLLSCRVIAYQEFFGEQGHLRRVGDGATWRRYQGRAIFPLQVQRQEPEKVEAPAPGPDTEHTYNRGISLQMA